MPLASTTHAFWHDQPPGDSHLLVATGRGFAVYVRNTDDGTFAVISQDRHGQAQLVFPEGSVCVVRLSKKASRLQAKKMFQRFVLQALREEAKRRAARRAG